MHQIKREAEQRGETVTSLIEEGLRLILAQSQQPPRRERVTLTVSKASGGVLHGVDLNDSAALLDILEPQNMEGRG
jgi:hypothetical protein